jgi:hypothetical protein
MDANPETLRFLDFATLLGPCHQRTNGFELTTLLRHEFLEYCLFGRLLDEFGTHAIRCKGRRKQRSAIHTFNLGILFLTRTADDIVASLTLDTLAFDRLFAFGTTHGTLKRHTSDAVTPGV